MNRARPVKGMPYTLELVAEPWMIQEVRGGMARDMTEEWVVVSDRDSCLDIVRAGFETAREAHRMREELERNDYWDDAVLLLMTRQQALDLIHSEG